MIARVLRGVAVAIALVAAIDPAVTTMRSTRPLISVVAGDARADSALARDVARRLAARFTVIEAPFSAAAAAVIAGRRLPNARGELPPTVFTVAPHRSAPGVSIAGVTAPARAALESRVPIVANVRTTGASGRTLTVTLRRGGLVVERADYQIDGDNAQVLASLSHVAVAPGAAALTIHAELAGITATAAADFVIEVAERRWSVLFHDPRPSWASTFVRRALERDPRFSVTSRVVTSRNISADAGRPPALDDVTLLADFDAVVAGAPELLTDRDVTGLDDFMRRRGGNVVLLFDQRGRGAYERLTNTRAWSAGNDTGATAITAANGESDSPGLRASDFAWPEPAPVGAETLAEIDAAGRGAGRGSSRPIVWRTAVGAGRLVVSGAFDAWQYRDPDASGFEQFWRKVIGDAASGSPAPVVIDVGPSPAVQNERVRVAVVVREAALGERSLGAVRSRVRATIALPDGAIPLRLLPEREPGHFVASFRAPLSPGTYEVSVTADGARGTALLVVASSAARAVVDDSAMVNAWTRSRGGAHVGESRIGELPDMVAQSISPEPRPETWYPMRSGWWIVPFALALGAEWWLRRRTATYR